MIQIHSLPRRLRLCIIGASALLAMSTAGAQSATTTSGTAASTELRLAVQDCNAGRTNQDKETCLKEARSAEAARKRGLLSSPDANFEANATARCDALTGEFKVACHARMKGYGTTSGSVASGGLLRQSETVVVPSGPGSVTITPKTDGPLVVIPSSN